ncbi:MAG TPA: CARDB domain-containing protein [Candidatus Thermoplasmatota archaeon]|nr:CARDB domain-containing protein [Candidatus Thermoplasmatota archaeon]
MAAPIGTLFGLSLRGWLSARGVWAAFAVALVPMLLTGSWVATHPADVEVTGVFADLERIRDGDEVTFAVQLRNVGGVDVGGFNVSLSVFHALPRVEGNRLVVNNETGRLAWEMSAETRMRPSRDFFQGERLVERVEGLPAGASTTVTFSWQAKFGVWLVLAQADPEDAVGEINERNNLAQHRPPGTEALARGEPTPLVVPFRLPEAGPRAPTGLEGEGETQANLSVRVEFAPREPRLFEFVNITATVVNSGPEPVENATFRLRAGRVDGGAFSIVPPVQDQLRTVSLGVGNSSTITISWQPPFLETYWIQAYAQPPAGALDPSPDDNVVAVPFGMLMPDHRQLVEDLRPLLAPQLEPPPRATIKAFYQAIFEFLHLHIILPFVALFYAAGVLADERERGTLPYVLTRPIPRWLLPLAKFAAGFVVAATAVILGIAAAFAVMFGAPGGDVGFLTTPLLASLAALFAYSAFFVLLGVLVDRPYLVGVAFVLGWETIAGALVPWVSNLTISHHVRKAFGGWPMDQGVQWAPAEGEPTTALLVVLLSGVAFLVAAAVAMKRREFPA